MKIHVVHFLQSCSYFVSFRPNVLQSILLFVPLFYVLHVELEAKYYSSTKEKVKCLPLFVPVFHIAHCYIVPVLLCSLTSALSRLTWSSLIFLASLDFFAAWLFLFRLSQYFSSFWSSGMGFFSPRGLFVVPHAATPVRARVSRGSAEEC